MTVARILVTGGAGFIGSHTVDRLLQQGKEVVVLDNLFSGKLTNLNLQHPQLEFIEGDVLEYPLLVDLLKDCNAVLHLAAIASVPYSIEHPIYSYQVNVQGFLHVLEAIRQSKRSIRLVYASSAAVYGEAKTLPCSDEVPLDSIPLSPYALQKIENERIAALYQHQYQVRSLALRYFNVYGPRQDPRSTYSGVISRFLDDYQKQQGLTIFGDGQQSRDFIHVHDVANANELALNHHQAGMINIATGRAETLLSLVSCIEKAGGHPAPCTFASPREGDIKTSYATTDKAMRELSFNYTISLQEGVKLLLG